MATYSPSNFASEFMSHPKSKDFGKSHVQQYLAQAPADTRTLNIPRSVNRESPAIGYPIDLESVGKYFGSARNVRHKPAFDSLESANAWIEDHRLTGRVKAEQMRDYDGDSVLDVVVYDRGQPVAMNGYMLGPGDFPYRNAFADYRVANPGAHKSEFIDASFEPRFDPEARRMAYNERYNTFAKDPGVKKHLPKQSASTLFYYYVFKPVFEDFAKVQPHEAAQLPALTTSNQMYKRMVGDKLLEAIIDKKGAEIAEDVRASGKEASLANIAKKVRASGEFRDLSKDIVMQPETRQQFQSGIAQFLLEHARQITASQGAYQPPKA
jgi:hypothetical protein